MRFTGTTVLAVLLFSGAGCEKLFQKDSERTLTAGDKKVAAGEVRMAIKFYEAALDGTPRSAEVHYKLAMIYDDKLHEPLNALHHFERYLELAPYGAHAKDVKEQEKTATERLAESLKPGGFITRADAAAVNKENLDLRMAIVKLKSQKAAPAPVQPTGPKGELVQKPLVPGVRTYVVQKGDTLGSIAAKFYKNKARWPQIRDANFENAKGTPPIRVGRELMVP